MAMISVGETKYGSLAEAVAGAKTGDTIAISGGVSANSALRQTLRTQAERAGLELLFPPPDLLTDNALMIAYAAAHHLAAGKTSPITEEISPNFQASAFAKIPA
jgi:N6-L-threonylcarbamoyladenine synthase